eukprot:Clim_evm17s156 gene=Clim_evmTU17s156
MSSAATAQSPSRANGNKAGGTSVTKRLQQELMTLMTCGEKGISAFPEDGNLFKWAGTIEGASETAYEGLKFKLSIIFTQEYPYKAPTVKFVTPIFHPNVDQHGNICLDILKEKWSALYDVRTILMSLQSLLGDPNNDSPLNNQAAGLWADQIEFRKQVLAKHKESL